MKDEFYCLLALGLCPALGQADVSDSINLHDGFEATLFAGPELADDIYSMTLDAKGRVVVSGRGYIRTLHDTDSDGRAEMAVQFAKLDRGTMGMLKHSGGDSLLILVNEDDHRHLGVDVTGLTPLNGRTLHQLYGDKQAVVRRGGIVTRMQPHEVKLFCTSPRFKTKQTKGRNYTDAGE